MRYHRESNTRWYAGMTDSMRTLGIRRAESQKGNESMPQARFCFSTLPVYFTCLSKEDGVGRWMIFGVGLKSSKDRSYNLDLHVFTDKEFQIKDCLWQLKKSTIMSFFSVPPVSSQIVTRRHIINYESLAYSLGFFLTSFYNLNQPIYSIVWCHCSSILKLLFPLWIS